MFVKIDSDLEGPYTINTQNLSYAYGDQYKTGSDEVGSTVFEYTIILATSTPHGEVTVVFKTKESRDEALQKLYIDLHQL